jgi:hypothetical protein
MDERRRLLEANAAAAWFLRRELLRATDGWPREYLKAHGAESVLSTDSRWKVGYAPRASSDLVDHLREQGVGYATMARAGLMAWSEDGDAVDRHRDKLMLRGIGGCRRSGSWGSGRMVRRGRRVR